MTGPASPELATLEDLAGKEVWVRRSSSYWGSLEALGRRLAAEKRPPLRLVEADEHLEDEDLLDMLNAGLIPLMVVDDHKARLWARVLPKITVHEDLAVREEGRIAFAIRKRSPKLKAALDAFVGKNGKGTTFGNVVFSRYLADADLVKDASSEAERRKFEKVLGLFRRFGDRYGFDPLMLAAQGYQELRLDNSVRSKAGAVGIMQVLPPTAEDPNVDIADVEVLENNVHAAAKYMRFVMDTYFPEAKMDPFNRTMFAFASYNAGPAKIAELRRQAAGPRPRSRPVVRAGGAGGGGAGRARAGAVRRQHPQVLRRVPPRRRAAGAQGEGAGGGAREAVLTLVELLRVAFPAACGAACSRQRARRPAHRRTRTTHRCFSEYPAPWGGGILLGNLVRLAERARIALTRPVVRRDMARSPQLPPSSGSSPAGPTCR